MRLAVTVAAAASLMLAAACTPEQIAAYNNLAPHEQAAVRTHWHTVNPPADCNTAMRNVWPQSTWAWAEAVIWRESRNNPAAQNARSTAAGCFQMLRVHAGRYNALGYTWDQRYNATVNSIVALDLYREQGATPWRMT